MFPGQVFHGRVDSVAPASGQEFALLPPDNATGNFTKVVQRIPVKIVLDPAQLARRDLAPGHVGLSDHRYQPQAVAAVARQQAETSRSLEGGQAWPTSTALSRPNPFQLDAPPRSGAEQASLTAWIAVVASMIGAFMAILNIQITNASLLDIEGGIGTGVDNGAWISTSYLIGEIVVIPLTDYLSRVFSFRRYILVNAILFPIFSIACAFTHDLGSMIVDARPAGLRRRHPDPDGLHHGADQAAEGAAADRPGLFARLRHLRAGDRPDHRRLSDAKTTAGRRSSSSTRCRASSWWSRSPARWSASRCGCRLLKEGDWAGIVTHGDRPLGAADRARGRQQGRLVRVAASSSAWPSWRWCSSPPSSRSS